MTAFFTFLSEKSERYIELRRSLGYTFDKQAGTLRAFVHHVERSGLDGPATRTMAQGFILSFRGAANGRAIRHGVLRRFYEYLALYDAPGLRPWSAKRSIGRGRFRRRASSATPSLRRSSRHAVPFRLGCLSLAARWRR